MFDEKFWLEVALGNGVHSLVLGGDSLEQRQAEIVIEDAPYDPQTSLKLVKRRLRKSSAALKGRKYV